MVLQVDVTNIESRFCSIKTTKYVSMTQGGVDVSLNTSLIISAKISTISQHIARIYKLL